MNTFYPEDFIRIFIVSGYFGVLPAFVYEKLHPYLYADTLINRQVSKTQVFLLFNRQYVMDILLTPQQTSEEKFNTLINFLSFQKCFRRKK